MPVSCAVFFGSLMVASVFYFRDRPFDFKGAVVSDLESPEDNPHGTRRSVLGYFLNCDAPFFHLRNVSLALSYASRAAPP